MSARSRSRAPRFARMAWLPAAPRRRRSGFVAEQPAHFRGKAGPVRHHQRRATVDQQFGDVRGVLVVGPGDHRHGQGHRLQQVVAADAHQAAARRRPRPPPRRRSVSSPMVSPSSTRVAGVGQGPAAPGHVGDAPAVEQGRHLAESAPDAAAPAPAARSGCRSRIRAWASRTAAFLARRGCCAATHTGRSVRLLAAAARGRGWRSPAAARSRT